MYRPLFITLLTSFIQFIYLQLLVVPALSIQLASFASVLVHIITLRDVIAFWKVAQFPQMVLDKRRTENNGRLASAKARGPQLQQQRKTYYAENKERIMRKKKTHFSVMKCIQSISWLFSSSLPYLSRFCKPNQTETACGRCLCLFLNLRPDFSVPKLQLRWKLLSLSSFLYLSLSSPSCNGNYYQCLVFSLLSPI